MMNKQRRRFVDPFEGRRSRLLALLTGLLVGMSAGQVLAQATPTPGAVSVRPAEDLTGLVAPIALYPDDLVSIILPAATNPLQIVQADRFLDKRKADPKAPLDERWDDAVKALLNYPDVVKKMSADLDWTAALGEAVVADQGAVLDAVQAFRRKAKAAGNLKTDGKQVVGTDQEIITIVPANPEVIYVPQYDPATVVVGGYPYWGYYPTPYPVYYYPYAPGAALAAGIIWGAAIGAAWNGGHYVSHYGGNANININRNTNINRGGGATTLPAGGSSAWKSNKQPGQVSSSIGKTAPAGGRVGDARGAVGGAGSYGGAGARPSTQPSGGLGDRGGGDAFGGYGSGRQTQMDSSRGAASRGSASSMGARPSPSYGGGGFSGGGGRSGGFGGGGGRGGGGRR